MTVESFTPQTRPLRGVVQVPGSKSSSNRALVCAALALEPSVLTGVADGDDTKRMIAGLCALGAEIEIAGNTVTVHRGIDRTDTTDVLIDAGLAGTTSRFLTAVAALRAGRTTVTGASGLQRRPMNELHRLLRDIGATVTGETAGHLPVTVSGSASSLAAVGSTSSDLRMLAARGDVSSQFISAIMMIAPLLGGVRVQLDGEVVSRGYLDMTAAVMREFGGAARIEHDSIVIDAGSYQGTKFAVEADWSSASYPFAAVALAGGQVRVDGLHRSTTQPEQAFVSVLARMGCTVDVDDHGVTVSRSPQQALVGIDVDMSEMSDLVPTLAAIACCATSASRIRGVGFIRAKESDRLGDLANELRACGANVVVESDGLAITPATITAATVNPHDDHRLALALSLLGLRQAGIVVDHATVVEKSWPQFWSAMRSGFQLA